MAEGIRVRHGRSCRSRESAKCSCRPTYEAFVYLRREDRKVRKSFPTLAAAKSWRADAKAAADKGRMRAPTQTTIKQAADEWLAGVKDGWIPNRAGDRYKPAAIRGYERSLTLRVLPELGHFKLSELARADVQDFADRLTGEGLSASTVQNTLDPFRVIFRRAMRRDVVAVDPTEHLELRRPKGRRERIATPAEAVELVAALEPFERVLWASAFYTGMRRGELRALRRSDVDLPGRVIHVRRGWDDVEGEQDGKSEAAARDVPVLDLLAPELAGHLLRLAPGGDPLVFGLSADQPFFPSTVRNRALAAWKAANEDREPDAQLEPIGLHEATPHVRERADRLGGEPEGHPEGHGPRHDRHDVRPVRAPDAGRARGGGEGRQRLPGAGSITWPNDLLTRRPRRVRRWPPWGK